MTVAATLAFLLFLQGPLGPVGDDQNVEPQPSSEALSAGTPAIGSITIEIGNIFDLDDPRENKRIFRLANHLHRTTRPRVVRNQLLFASGDALDPQILAETERLLRQSRYLSDAQIETTAVEPGKVDVVVKTRDTWSLEGGVSFGRRGGANRTTIKITDTNILGTGKLVDLRKTFGVDRDTLLFRYRDPNLLGGRSRLVAEFSNNSDGETWNFEMGLPFFSLDSHRSLGVSAFSDQRITPLYHRGQVVDQFLQESRRFELSRGFSRGLIDGRTRRWTVGLTWEEVLFAASPESPSTVVPTDRTLAYPWVAFEQVGDHYLETENFDRIGRTEDRYLGTRFQARLGLSPRLFSGDRGRFLFASELSHNLELTEASLLDLTTSIFGRWGSAGLENVRWSGEAKYYRRVWQRHRFFARLRLAADHRRDSESQLLLGGDSGLRGYPLRFQDGDRQFLVTLEQRFFTQRNLFRVANVGGAIFFDVGRAWTPGFAGDAGSGTLSDVGIGLRLGLNRSSSGNVLHLDLAFPVDKAGGESQGVQWLVSTRQSF